MKDTLTTLGGAPFPSEEDFQESCEQIGGEFTDSNFSMTCEVDNSKIILGIEPHDGPFIRVIENDVEVLNTSIKGAETINEDDALVVVYMSNMNGNNKGSAGEYVILR